MKSSNSLAAVLLTTAMLAPAWSAQAAAEKPASHTTGKTNETGRRLAEQAATSAEHATEEAIGGNAAKTETVLKTLQGELPRLKSHLAPADFESATKNLGLAQSLLSQKDLNGAALASAEIYRTLQQAMIGTAGPVPLEVALLDYSGFKLEALSKTPAPDWHSVALAAEEAQSFWQKLAPRVKSKALRNTVATILAGLKEGVERNNASQSIMRYDQIYGWQDSGDNLECGIRLFIMWQKAALAECPEDRPPVPRDHGPDDTARARPGASGSSMIEYLQ